MKIGIFTSHLHDLGGGACAVKAHVRGLAELGHQVVVFTRNDIHPRVLDNWFQDVSLARYYSGCESGFDWGINIDHFVWAQPLARTNLAHIFFPTDYISPPPDGVRLYANSAYTGAHIRHKWNRDCEVLYIPIDNGFHVVQKENLILHVSRFSRPSVWADKGYLQMIETMRMIGPELQSLGNWKLILAGVVEDDQHQYFNELLQTADGLPVEFLPNQKWSVIQDLYARAAIYWHATGVSMPDVPSAQEHLGLSPLEASASGAVPVVFRSGGIPEVVRENETGLMFEDLRELGEKTLDLIRDTTKWSSMSQHGVLWARAWQDIDAFKMRLTCMLAGVPIPELPRYKPEVPYRPIDVTCVIPSFDNPQMLDQCLTSLEKTAPAMKVIVINNGTRNDDLLSAHPKAQFMLMDQNLGFGGSYRLAEGFIQTPLILMLNDDVVANYAGWLEWMLLSMNCDNVGVVGARLLFPDGRIQHAGGEIDWSTEDVGYHRLYGQPDSLDASLPAEVPFVTGACLLIRRELFEMPTELDGLLNYEDTWLCMSAKERGYRVIYQPAATLIHFEGVTKQKSPDSQEKVNAAKEAFRGRWFGK